MGAFYPSRSHTMLTRFLFLISILFVCCNAQCTSNDDCEEYFYCNQDLNCNSPGVCQETPFVCNIADNAPHCDCNGKLHDSACIIHSLGLSVGFVGQCNATFTFEDYTFHTSISSYRSNSTSLVFSFVSLLICLFVNL